MPCQNKHRNSTAPSDLHKHNLSCNPPPTSTQKNKNKKKQNRCRHKELTSLPVVWMENNTVFTETCNDVSWLLQVLVRWSMSRLSNRMMSLRAYQKTGRCTAVYKIMKQEFFIFGKSCESWARCNSDEVSPSSAIRELEAKPARQLLQLWRRLRGDDLARERPVERRAVQLPPAIYLQERPRCVGLSACARRLSENMYEVWSTKELKLQSCMIILHNNLISCPVASYSVLSLLWRPTRGGERPHVW